MKFGLCRNCKHWKITDWVRQHISKYPENLPEKDWYLSAVCKRIQFGTEISASGGWDGAVVDSVETDANFGCRFFEDKT